MATTSDAMAVKSLNKCSGRRRFVFKNFSQRIQDIDIDVYRSLDPLKTEPSEGSSFFRDCLVQYRELNTAEDFISFYEEMLPLVQTLPQIVLQKDLILLELLSRLNMKGRLSLEPILRLIAALSRDLVDDFLPFLQRVADSLVVLLKNGADREPEIIEQIFTSWSYIMMYLQKYLTKDVVYVLKVTVKLRYFPKDYVQEFMAESVSFLLRNASVKQLKKGIQNLMIEVVKKPSLTRKSGISSLLWYAMRGTSSRFHSRADQVLRLLLDNSLYSIDDHFNGGPETVLEVVIGAFQRLCEELDAKQLDLMWDCLFNEITNSVANGHSMHLCRLLSLLISTVQKEYVEKISDYQPMLEVISLLVQTYIVPSSTLEALNPASELVDKILSLMLCVVDGLHKTNNLSALSCTSLQWAPVFDLRNKSLATFVKDFISKDPSILYFFRANIISALNDLLEIPEDEIIYLLHIFCERLQVQQLNFLDGIPNEKFLRICSFLDKAINFWIQLIKDAVNKDFSSAELTEDRLAVLWGTIGCYPYMIDAKRNPSLLMDLIYAIDELLTVKLDLCRKTWQCLIGATLGSFLKILDNRNAAFLESEVSKLLDLARRHSMCSQILSAVADILDSIYGKQANTPIKRYHPELAASKVVGALDIFSENLRNCDKEIRLSTLRILCHYEPLCDGYSTNGHAEKKRRIDDSQICAVDDQQNNVVQLLLSVEEMPLSIATSRKVILLISKIHMSLSASRIDERYIVVALNGVLGIFHNRFTYLWGPALDCTSVLLGQYFGILWDRFVKYLDYCLSIILGHDDQAYKSNTDSFGKDADLIGRFCSYRCSMSDSTPSATVLSLLIQSLQRVPSVVESRSRQIIPLFLKFLGYSVDDLVSVESYNILNCKGKEWKEVLKEWLNLFKLMKNPKAFYQSQFFKDVLQYRLLDENDAELQMKVLDCLMNWKDNFLLPYDQHLKNLISAKNLREELTTWSLSRDSNLIDAHHRHFLVPTVIRILAPKVRKLKSLASRKHASVSHRKAILCFLAQLDVEELPLFFSLLVKPLVIRDAGFDANVESLWTNPQALNDEYNSFNVFKHFTTNIISNISWKKRYSFLHVIEDTVAVFDEAHISPFLNLLMECISYLLESCALTLGNTDSSLILANCSNVTENETETQTAMKQSKELRSLCLRIISFILNKYENHDFSSKFWDSFFKSVKPLISGFKQEGASSEKPSSLFSCFLAMSRSYKLVPLLYREKNLVPDIFSMLSITTASKAIVCCVLKFIENLLTLDNEQSGEGNSIKMLLLPHLDVLVSSLHNLFVNDGPIKRKLAKYPGENELNVFKLLSVYVEEPLAARKFVDVLLPLLSKKSHACDICVDTLQIIKNIARPLGNESIKKILKSISPLLISGDLDVRGSVCDVLDALARNDSSLLNLAKLLRELNATSASEMGDLDYDTIISAYGKLNVDFFHNVEEEHALIILSNSIRDLSSEDLILRQSAFRLLSSFVEYSGQILEQEMKPERGCSGSWVMYIINNFLLKHMGNAMNKEGAAQKLWIGLLRVMVLKLYKMVEFKTYAVLCSEDPEQDFFNNIVHLQRHRRARALSRFGNVVGSGSFSEGVMNRVFVPLLFNMLLDLQNGKGENIRNACIEALASISKWMDWNAYYGLLVRCFREMTLKQDKQKVLMRLICTILDQFHFSEANFVHEIEGSMEHMSDPDTSKKISAVSSTFTSKGDLSKIQICLKKDVLPKVQKFLMSDSENVNVTISLVALKVLKLLPGDIMELQLPSIIHRISNFLKNRLESVRDEARSALAACLKELGLEYLQFIIKVLRGTLKRGFELHVLGYTLNFILTKFLQNPTSLNLDYCLEDLLSVAESDILGDVSEEKEVEKIASKMKETKKQKSYETLKLIAQNITFKTHALKLLLPVTVHLQKQLTPKVKTKLENMLNHISSGIQSNPSVNQKELFVFAYGLIKDGLKDEHFGHEDTLISDEGKQNKDEVKAENANSNRLISVDRRYSYLITEFAVGILQNYLRNMELDKGDEKLLSMLDPFVRLLGDCLSSKYENIIFAALKCLYSIVRLPLPTLENEANRIKNSLLVIAQGSVNASTPLMESCIKLLTVLLQNTKMTLSEAQLQSLIQFPFFVDLERNPSFVALSLLKAIIKKKLVAPEIYDVIKGVAELMVTSQVESIRRKCSKIFLLFLDCYPISVKRFQQHLDSLLANLRYEHSTGREAVLEMLRAIIVKIPDRIQEQSQTIFMHLVICLANDQDNKVRSMAGVAIKLLAENMKKFGSLTSIIEYSFSWYRGEKQHLWSSAAQVLGLLVEVMGNSFQEYVTDALSVTKKILQSAHAALANRQLGLSDEVVPLWKEVYYSLVLLEKIHNQFTALCFTKELEDLWETICDFLLYPHMWVRSISVRLIDLYFARVTKACNENQALLRSFFLMEPSRLFRIAVSLICQLNVQLVKDADEALITQNLVFAICGIQALLVHGSGHSAFGPEEQSRYLKAFNLLDPKKGRNIFTAFTSYHGAQGNEQQTEHQGSMIVSCLLKRMGKIPIQMEALQTRIVFNCFKSISIKLLDQPRVLSSEDEVESQSYAYQILLPLYKVCEGQSGKVISDDVKQLAQEVCDSIRDVLGMQSFVQVYSQIRKNLKAKRDKRKQEEKLMAVVNPMRNAKRKLRIAAKHKANKKRKIMSMKMTRWMQ
nr:small subunit processome component 20 homolog [Ipomoea trifida]